MFDNGLIWTLFCGNYLRNNKLNTLKRPLIILKKSKNWIKNPIFWGNCLSLASLAILIFVNMIRCVIDTFCCQFGHKRHDRWGSGKCWKRVVGDDKNIWEFLHPAAYCQGGTYSFKNTLFSSSISYIFLGFGGKNRVSNGTFWGLHCHSLEKILESLVVKQSCRLVGEINGKWSFYVLDKKMDKNKSCLKFDRQPAITWVTGSKLGPFSPLRQQIETFFTQLSGLQQLLF